MTMIIVIINNNNDHKLTFGSPRITLIPAPGERLLTGDWLPVEDSVMYLHKEKSPAPWGPCGPINPWEPLNPWGPIAPWDPLNPWGPSGPIGSPLFVTESYRDAWLLREKKSVIMTVTQQLQRAAQTYSVDQTHVVVHRGYLSPWHYGKTLKTSSRG